MGRDRSEAEDEGYGEKTDNNDNNDNNDINEKI